MRNVIPIRDDDDDLGVAADGGVLLHGVGAVDAVCTAVKTIEFKMYKRKKLVMTFEPFAPPESCGIKLYMYVRVDDWRRIPTASKLYKIACVALGHRLRGERVTKSLFVGKAFRCRLKTIGNNASAYSIIETLIEKL